MAVTAYAASVGHSVWFSQDLGETWNRAFTPTGGIYNESRAWCVNTHPERPGEVLAGTDIGLYRWTVRESRWVHIPSPMDGLHILQVAQAPHDPETIYAGTRPAMIFKSTDDGRTWRRCEIGNDVECDFINTPRVTSIHFDPREHDTVWVTVEIDGVFRTRDGGVTWEKLNGGLTSPDTHNLVFFDDAHRRIVLCSTEEGLHRSDDNGSSWQHVKVPQAPWPYFRCIRKRADDSGIVFLSVGDKPSGEHGLMFRSRDYGMTWARIDLPTAPNTTIWWIATNAADPMLIFACTIFGQIFRSTDGGENWVKMKRELGELRMIGWQPA
jgi:photosystem II stability/assembly factor-like uncharacterized protein